MRILLPITLALLASYTALSQERADYNSSESFPFHHIEYINTEQGLNGSEVYWIMEDKQGFMWMVTDNALNRFDGYSFKSFAYRPEDPNSISTGWYWGLTEDKSSTLWIPSERTGIFSFDPRYEKWVHFRHGHGLANSLISDLTLAIAAGDSGCMWIGTQKGLDKFNPSTKNFIHFVHNENDSSSISLNFIYSLVLDSQYSSSPHQKNLWVFHGTPRLDCFDTKTGKVTKHFDFPFAESVSQWTTDMDININQNHKETIWIGSDDKGIYGFNLATQQFVQIKMEHQCRSSLHAKGFYSVVEDHAGNLWTTDDDNEVVYYNISAKKFYFYPVQKKSIHFYDVPADIYEDRSHRIWIATNDGLIAFDTEQKEIYSFQHNENDSNSIAGNVVFGINRAAGKLFINSNHIQTFERKSGKFSNLDVLRNSNTYATWTVYEDSKNTIWFVGSNGIFSYDPRSKKIRDHQLKTDSGDLNSYGCAGLVEDKNGRFWTGNWYGGLYSFNPATDDARDYSVHEGKNSISTNSTGSVFIDSRGTLYTCGWEGGFITFNVDSETFTIYRHDANDPSSVSQETAHSWLENESGLIWFCTLGGGVGVFNPVTKKFKSFTMKDGLANNYVEAMVKDQKGNYWAATRGGGISCFTPPKNSFDPNCKMVFRNYDVSDGLPSNVMNLSSAFCDTDGTLFFGTRNAGMLYFHPDSLKDNQFIPPVYITDFSLMNKPVSVHDSNSVLKSTIEFTKELLLNYRQNTLSFTFAALNFVHPEKNRYAYKLQGLDQDWIYTDASKRFVSYTNLDPGEYIFKVKGSNNDGVWNETPTELKIIITPPFWQTVWFKILVLAALLSMAYGFYCYRISQILFLQKIRNKIAADLHDDIGSTLNSISVYSEVAKQQAGKPIEALDHIGASARKIIESLSDIVWTINPENDTFEKVIVRMRSFTHQILKAKKIEFTFKADPNLNKLTIPMQVRKNFYLIFKEAINNLVKYSNAERASILITNAKEQVKLLIRDNGEGFDSSREYNGNGLLNMKRRAKEIKAQLIIESTIGIGTSVELVMKS